eukprot:scaffold29795_cov46-Phaeocystis_antarctica.AAC.1
MRDMFSVRSSPALLPICSRALPCVNAACTAVARRLPPPGPQLAPHRMCSPSDSRQYALAFNQPLSFDTSSVRDMNHMFFVRSSPCPAPNLQSSPSCTLRAPRSSVASRAAPRPARYALRSTLGRKRRLESLLPAACAAFVRRLPGRSTSPRSAFPPVDSRQYASAFNQPLTFDTSSVRDMNHMFRVRSPPWPAPNLHSSPPLNAACPVVARRPPASRAAPRPAPHALLSTRQRATAFNQPLSFDTSSVMTMESMFSVLSARALAPGLQLGPPRARRLRHT